ncbi:hypothetical protein WJX75_004452 [Coccomyxa subellipsoidea]|uniref:Kinesin motor domain-containing protein n=1 Tax=Coccomyxa subellipsoidea TaxID=248742 RepID=A0ABR2YC80_9CHLO
MSSACRDEVDEEEPNLGPLEAGAGVQARKVAAQAVIELTDRLTRAEQENSALRQRLHETRRLSKVGQELEDVLAERDALRNVNQELALKITSPQPEAGSAGQGQEEPDALQGLRDELAGVQQQLTAALEDLERERANFKQTREATADQAAASATVAKLKRQYIEERNLRREVHEELQVLRGNIRVVCRARPAAPDEEPILAFPMAGALTVSPPDRRISDFEFNACFGPDSTQEDVFEEIAPLIRSCVDGYNACIFAYGQTGSGKTHTMQGPPEDPGVYQRALQELFAAMGGNAEHAHAPGGGYISVAMLEIYNDDARDLLADAVTGKAASLDVSGLGAGQLPPGVERIPGLTWRQVATVDHVAAVLADGSRQRSTAATAMNSSSSRSHAILSVKICADAATGACSLLHLVDLAGSERVGRSEVAGTQMKEAQSINKSLSALGDVVSALQRRASHIPFRNSKLTQARTHLCLRRWIGHCRMFFDMFPVGNPAAFGPSRWDIEAAL